jgi:gamma-carbonic anhydrase
MPIIEHRGRRPRIHPNAYIAPTATISGEVSIGADARILFGAVITAEDAPVTLDERVVIMENALVRGRHRHPTLISQDVLVGPHAHLNGTRVERDCFLATGCCLFPGSQLGAGTEVRIHGVVHVNTQLPPNSLVPIGWIAVGNPAAILPPDQHEDIWAIQRQLDFPTTVYGLSRDTPAQQRMAQQTAWFGAHQDDQIVDDIRTSSHNTR